MQCGRTSHEERALRATSGERVDELLGVLIWPVIVCECELSGSAALGNDLSLGQL